MVDIIRLHDACTFLKLKKFCQIVISHQLYMWPDLTKASFNAHSKHVHFSPLIDSFIHQLTIDGYFTVHSSSVCFSHGLFLWPVWCPRAHRCSLNGPGAGWKVANLLKMSSKVDIDVRNWFSSILGVYGLKWPLVWPIWLFMWQIKFCKALFHPLPPHPPPLRRDISDIDCTGLKTI